MKKKVFALAFALVMALGIMLTACGGGTSSSTGGGGTSTGGDASTSASTGGDDVSTPAGGDTDGMVTKDNITVASQYIVAKIDPQYGAGQWEWSINRGVYDSLFRAPKMDYYACEPWLAESYEYSDDNLDMTLTLRQGVKFHDGSEMTSEDVVYSLERAMVSAYTSPALQAVDSVEATDDYTVVIHMKYTFPVMVEVLADYQFGAIVSKNAIETYGEGSQEAIVGTGPYKLKEWSADNNITLEYFEDYWADEPEIKTVTYRAIPDYSAAAIAMQSGEIDVLNYGLMADLKSMSETGDFTVNSFLRDHTFGLAINNQLEPFNNLEVRRAISHAIDRDAVNDIVMEGTGSTETLARTSPRGEGYYMALDEGRLTKYEYDVEKAKAMMEELGYGEDNRVPVNFVSPSSSAAQNFAAVMQEQLGKIYLDLDIEVMEASSYINRLAQGQFGLSYNDSGLMPYFSPVLYSFQYGTGNIYNRDNISIPEVDALLEQGLSELDKDARNEIYAEMLEIITDQAVTGVCVQTRAFIISTKGLQVYPDPVMMPSAVYDMHWGEHDDNAITAR
ncbi:MAG: ABC transporter substrate-binding protein, partial [Ruminococcaceae bacterium]|nr:ABC transporter substrate-binding protein [Oscillospiraceae bacterium]